MEELLHEVDLALYNAKAVGRDCLRIAHPADEAPRSELRQPARQRR